MAFSSFLEDILQVTGIKENLKKIEEKWPKERKSRNPEIPTPKTPKYQRSPH